MPKCLSNLSPDYKDCPIKYIITTTTIINQNNNRNPPASLSGCSSAPCSCVFLHKLSSVYVIKATYCVSLGLSACKGPAEHRESEAGNCTMTAIPISPSLQSILLCQSMLNLTAVIPQAPSINLDIPNCHNTHWKK